jgi:diaminohydroxyphosphoribosylaminopyrimidine deaminase / 5-amino-6-(5-phosphoribosylamino)uracil reductase
MNQDQIYMQRCLELAKLGLGKASPNPIVGAVLVHENNIIGEGYYAHFGGPHAEVNCINSVKQENIEKIKDATLYVSLEPCCIFGKTPPCTALIIKNEIKHVVIGCKDVNSSINGKGIQQLKNAGIKVDINVLEASSSATNTPFFYNQLTKLPYVILKWAQTQNGFIANSNQERLLISNAYTNKWMHQLRYECDAILVGTQTVLKDNPHLNTRLVSQKKITRIIIDKQLLIPITYHIYDSAQPTIILNCVKEGIENGIEFIQLRNDADFLNNALVKLYQKNIGRLLVEGGAVLLQSFIDKGFWNKCYQITNQSLFLLSGLVAPLLEQHQKIDELRILSDKIDIYTKQIAS